MVSQKSKRKGKRTVKQNISKYITLKRTNSNPVELINILRIELEFADDGGRSPVVVYAKKCEYDEKIGIDLIQRIRGSLPTHQANQGVLITNGTVTPEGKKEALGYRPDVHSVPPVHIMDIDIILNVLLESRTGVRTKNVEVLLLDQEFFKNPGKTLQELLERLRRTT